MNHPSAEIERDVQLGEGVVVWHLCHIRAGARIGARSRLGRNVFVDAGVTIGQGCKIQNNVSIYAGVTLEDEVFVGPGVIFTNDRSPRASAESWTLSSTLVGRGASLGAGAVIVCPRVIGTFGLVGAGAVVTRDVPPHALVMGNPATVRGWVCECGERVSDGEAVPQSLVCDACQNLGGR